MNRTAKTLQLFTGFAAQVGTPVIMIAGFTVFGTFAAVQFRIYDMAADYGAGVITSLVLLEPPAFKLNRKGIPSRLFF